MEQVHKCAECNRNDVRLYRRYSFFLREDDIFCKAHIPAKGADNFVPLVEDAAGDVWGHNTSPDEADMKRFKSLPENEG